MPDLPVPTEASYLRYALDHPVPPATEDRAATYWVALRAGTTGCRPMADGDRADEPDAVLQDPR